MSSPESQAVSVESLADEYLDRLRRGENPGIDEYAKRFPQLADEIRAFFPTLKLVERFKPDERDEASAENRGRQSATSGQESIPSQLGDYHILREVARGGMGVVYEAAQESLGRTVALKVLPANALANVRTKKRFQREARAAARLHHTNIVPVFGVGEADGVHYYAMQFIHGLGLDQVLEEIRRLRAAGAKTDGSTQSESARVAKAKTMVAPTVAAGGYPNNGPTAVYFVRSLASGQFALQDFDHPADSGSDDANSGGFTVTPQTDASKSTDPGDTGVGLLSDTASYALPGQGESSSGAASATAYWHSVARIGAQVANALQYAHDNGILHRDVKPSNLLLDARGTVWVTDFGLAKADDHDNLTRTGDVVGTLRYMAPELFNGKSDARSDVYSLGLTLYELLALKPAFGESNRHALIQQVMNESPARLRTIDRHIPRDLEIIVHKAIERDPRHRYQSAGELAADLRLFLGNEPIRARRVSTFSRFRRWCKRNKTVATLLGTIFALLSAAVVVSIIAASSFRDLAESNSDLADEKEDALIDAKRRLFESSLEEARSSRWSGRPGQRLSAMAAIDRASGIAEELNLGEEARNALRDEAIAAMSLVDLESVRIWNGPKHTSWKTQFSPDLSLFAFHDRDRKAIRVRSASRPAMDIAVVPCLGYPLWFYFRPDNGQLILHMSGPTHVSVWNLPSGREAFSLKPPGAWTCGDISEDGRLLVVGEERGRIGLYNLRTGAEIATHPATKPVGRVSRVEFSPDGQNLAVHHRGSGTIELRETSSGRVIRRLSMLGGKDLWALAWDPKGRWFAAGGWKQINLWDLRQPSRSPLLLPGHESAIDQLHFHPSGEIFVSKSWDGTTRIWEAASGFQLLQLEETFPQFSADGRYLVTRKGRKFHTREVILPAGIRWVYGNQLAFDVKVNATGRLLAIAFGDGVRFYDLVANREVGVLSMPRSQSDVQFHPVNGSLVTANSKGVLEWPLRPTEAAEQKGEFKLGPPEQLDKALRASDEIEISRNGRTIMAKFARASTASVLRTASGSRRQFRISKPSLRRIALSRDGNWAAVGNWGRSRDAGVWNVRTGKHELDLKAESACWPVFSPDSRWIVVNGGDSVRFWEVGTWKLRYEFPADVIVPSPVAFTHDSRIAAMGRRGLGLHLVNMANGKLLAMLSTNQRRPHFEAMTFTPDNATLIASRGDAGVCIWDLRAIRRRLKAMGLDWNQPPLPPAPDPKTLRPLKIIVDRGETKKTQ